MGKFPQKSVTVSAFALAFASAEVWRQQTRTLPQRGPKPNPNADKKNFNNVFILKTKCRHLDQGWRWHHVLDQGWRQCWRRHHDLGQDQGRQQRRRRRQNQSQV